MDRPLLSVIVVCLNPGEALRVCADSLHRQTSQDFEWIVKDGGSTDGTAEWLREAAQPTDRLLAGPDRGVYDAMNQALAVARGEWVLFLGADDALASPTVVASIGPALVRSTGGVVAGSARYRDGRVYRFTDTRHALRRNFLHHQAAFFRRDPLVASGGFDPSFRIQGDYEANLRLLTSGTRFEAVDLLVSICGPGGLSDAGSWLNYAEEIRARARHVHFRRRLLWDLLAVGRYFRKKLLAAAKTRPE
jgi:putative colanic acid biosynthesis glycosyltransferase